ncbi:cytoplasmic alpha-amylase, partial [Prevotella sp. MGM1]
GHSLVYYIIMCNILKSMYYEKWSNDAIFRMEFAGQRRIVETVERRCPSFA